jgi:chitodextrinase
METLSADSGAESLPISRWSVITLTVFLLGASAFLTPPVHGEFLVSGSSSSSVTLTWTAPGDDGNVGTATQYDIRYATSPIADSNWDSAISVPGVPSPQPADSHESFTVENLTPSTTYYFAIKTADEVPNWSPLSNVTSATTDPEQDPPSTIADLNVSGATSTTATLAWTAPGDDGDSGTATQYDIRFAISPITEANWDSCTQVIGEPSPQIAGSSETFTVQNLSPSTTYYFAVKTADEVPNWSNLSNVPVATTSPEEVAPADITDLMAINPTGTSLTLIWTAPGDDGDSGTAAQYDIRFATSPITEANWTAAAQISGVPSPQPAGSNESFTVEDLNPNTTYYFAIKTADEVPNWSGLSNVASDSTTGDQTPPGAITDLQSSSGS